MTSLDYGVVAFYLLFVAAFGIFVSGRQSNAADYFVGGRDLPWWAVSFSIVATETSTLTILGVPVIAYGGSLLFLQLAMGYLLGRTLVSLVFLPMYFKGDFISVYGFIGQRFGKNAQLITSITFLITRLLADGVRLFATAIPIKVISDLSGFDITYLEIISLIAIFTIAYTLIGGIKAVIWMDVIQLFLYTGGAFIAIAVLLGEVPADWWQRAADAGKTQVIDLGLGTSDDGGNIISTLSVWLTSPYVLATSVIGGALFSMASHGTDQLIVQRLLSCRSLLEGQRALISSAVAVGFQFALFLILGLLLWNYYEGASMEALGLGRMDEIYPRYIIQNLPPGISGLLMAGILAAAMSTLSSSLNSLAASSMVDIWRRFSSSVMSTSIPAAISTKRELSVSRWLTLFWGLVMIGFASLFTDMHSPVVELGLSIASFTYGSLLGLFLLGRFIKQADQTDAIITFAISFISLALIISGLVYQPGSELGWHFDLSAGPDAKSIAWPLYPLIGGCISLFTGKLLSLRHKI